MNGIIQWSPGVTLEAVEKQVILAAFRFYRGNKTQTAVALGIAVRTLDAKLDQYKADKKSDDERIENAKRERDEFLYLQRNGRPAVKSDDAGKAAGVGRDGDAPSTESKDSQHVENSNSGVYVESASQAGTKSDMPMPQREKVQGVLPSNPSANRKEQRR